MFHPRIVSQLSLTSLPGLCQAPRIQLQASQKLLHRRIIKLVTNTLSRVQESQILAGICRQMLQRLTVLRAG